MSYNITNCTGDDIDYIDGRLVNYNLDKMPAECEDNRVVIELCKKMMDSQGMIIAGCLAVRTVWNTAEVSVLWVDADYRKQGLGSMILKEVEQEAKAKGCTIIHLDTFDWQAKEFYEKNGYSVFGTLEDCPKGHCRYYMKKVL